MLAIVWPATMLHQTSVQSVSMLEPGNNACQTSTICTKLSQSMVTQTWDLDTQSGIISFATSSELTPFDSTVRIALP